MTHLPLDVFQQVILSMFEVRVLKLNWTISLLFHNACVDMHHLTEPICTSTPAEAHQSHHHSVGEKTSRQAYLIRQRSRL